MNYIEHIKTEHIVALALAVLGFVCGALVSNVTHESECASELVNLAKQRLTIDELRDDVQRCKSERAGVGAIDCTAVCAKQVKSALNTAREWACED